MISHEHKCIFIHIPKTAGTSINSFFHPKVRFHFEHADYERLFGWCPKRQLHMQHATSKQLIETELITETQWKEYYKFTFVRNPWDRSYSDYYWIQEFSGVTGSFKDYINATGPFTEILNDISTNRYLGDHLLEQTAFFDFNGLLKPDFIGRFENFKEDMATIIEALGLDKGFDVFKNKGKKKKGHYSKFYTNTNKGLVDQKYFDDIKLLNYEFEDRRRGLSNIKKFF